MAQRSRKRGRRGRAPGATHAPASTHAPGATHAPDRTTPVPGATRSAGGGRVPISPAAPPSGAPPRPGGYARAEARNEAVRAGLTPYAEGERPWAIVVSAILAAGFGTFNLISFLAGTKLDVAGTRPGAAGVILFALVMFVCAGGMWRMRYWAVLGFQVLLLLVLLTFAILLIKVSNLAGLAVCLVGLGVGGLLFYKLVRAMSRMQVPARERR